MGTWALHQADSCGAPKHRCFVREETVHRKGDDYHAEGKWHPVLYCTWIGTESWGRDFLWDARVEDIDDADLMCLLDDAWENGDYSALHDYVEEKYPIDWSVQHESN